MLTGMTEADWSIVLEVFDAVQSRRGEPGHNDRRFLEALHFFTLHNLTWRALPAEYGNWNSVWKRFWRLSRSGVFEAFFQALAELSPTAHLVQMFDSTVARAHVSAAGAKGGKMVRRSAGPGVGSLAKSTSRRTLTVCPSQTWDRAGDPTPLQHKEPAYLLPPRPLQGSRSHRAIRGQAQAVQAGRPAMRKNRRKLRLYRRFCLLNDLGQIRPQDLEAIEVAEEIARAG